ncbi:MAG: substrate-binding periplasmic protein [Salibacteraceae bacterium]
MDIKKVIFLICFLHVSTGIFSQVERITLGSNIWPPFTNTSGNKAVSTDIVREALSRSGLKSKHVIKDFGHVLEELKSNSLDGCAAIWFTKERSNFLNYSDPYLINKLILVGKKGNPIQFSSLNELGNKRVAIVADYAYGNDIETASNVKFIKGENDQENLNLLLKDTVDYVLVEALLIEYLKLEQGEAVNNLLEIGQNTMIEQPLYFVLRKNYPGSDSIITRFNIELNNMIVEGIYNRILELNWIEVDVDNDGKTELVLKGKHAGITPPENSYSVFKKDDSIARVDQRFFIDGKYYDSWNDVPEFYKKSPPKTNKDLNPSYKIKL